MPRLLVLLAAVCFGTTGVRFTRGLRHLTPGERPGAVAAIGAALVLSGLLTLALPARTRRLRLASAPA